MSRETLSARPSDSSAGLAHLLSAKKHVIQHLWTSRTTRRPIVSSRAGRRRLRCNPHSIAIRTGDRSMQVEPKQAASVEAACTVCADGHGDSRACPNRVYVGASPNVSEAGFHVAKIMQAWQICTL